MYTGKLVKFFKQKVTEKAQQMGKSLGNLSDPKVGSHIINLQHPKLLVRVDGRSHTDFHQQGGLLARNTLEQILSIRFSDVERYQKYNEKPFAWGACSTITELDQFLEDNKGHTKESWIHMFYGNATCLGSLKVHTGIDSDGFDKEREQLVIEDLPFSRWLASTCPEYRDKFQDGRLVPNAMVDFNKDLPKTLRKQDMATERNIMHWLLVNRCEETFADICQHLYANVTPVALARRFEGDATIVDAIEYFTSASSPAQPRL